MEVIATTTISSMRVKPEEALGVRRLPAPKAEVAAFGFEVEIELELEIGLTRASPPPGQAAGGRAAPRRSALSLFRLPPIDS
jgi:hypothetical protein